MERTPSQDSNPACSERMPSLYRLRHLHGQNLKHYLHCLPEFTPPVWFLCFTSFNHSLLIVNPSCNFLIYCSVGAKFKTTISKFFGRWGCCPTPVTSSPTIVACGVLSGANDSPLPMIVMAKQVSPIKNLNGIKEQAR